MSYIIEFDFNMVSVLAHFWGIKGAQIWISNQKVLGIQALRNSQPTLCLQVKYSFFTYAFQ